MKYKMIKRVNPANREGGRKWHAIPVKSGRPFTLTDVAIQISGRSSLTRGDLSNALQNLVDQLPMLLLLGHSVQLGDLGSLRISFGSDGVDTPEEFNPNMIRNVKIIFTPGKLLKKALADIVFELQH